MLPAVPVAPVPDILDDPTTWMLRHDYTIDDVADNSKGHLVGATMSQDPDHRKTPLRALDQGM